MRCEICGEKKVIAHIDRKGMCEYCIKNRKQRELHPLTENYLDKIKSKDK